MSSVPSFQRARKPHEKAHRERAILEAAAALFEAEWLNGVSLNAVARRAGLAKSNLYRYFESREAILLALLGQDQAAWVASLEEGLARLTGRVDARAVALAHRSTDGIEIPDLVATERALSAREAECRSHLMSHTPNGGDLGANRWRLGRWLQEIDRRAAAQRPATAERRDVTGKRAPPIPI